MNIIWTKNILTLAAVVASTVATFVPAAVRAESYDVASPLVVGTNTLTIMPGSQAESLTATDSGFTVTVAAGEAFEVRAPGPRPLAFFGDGITRGCNVLRTRENQLIINGPITTTVNVSLNGCSTDDASEDRTPIIRIETPNGASTYDAGQSVSIFWSVNGRQPGSVRLSLSLDGGATYSQVLGDELLNNGSFYWTVPALDYNSRARVRVHALDSGRIVAMDVSDADFVIRGALGEAPAAPEALAAHTPYDPAAVTAAADSIDHDRGFMPTLQLVGSTVCTPGVRLKGATSAAVYYCGHDGKRHAFPNQRIHDSWFQGWAGVVTLTDAELAAIPLGKNVTYRPGVRLVKVTTDPKVYAIGPNGTLRWIPDEWTARALYGLEWNKMVDDMPDSMFASDYVVGEMVPAVGA